MKIRVRVSVKVIDQHTILPHNIQCDLYMIDSTSLVDSKSIINSITRSILHLLVKTYSLVIFGLFMLPSVATKFLYSPTRFDQGVVCQIIAVGLSSVDGYLFLYESMHNTIQFDIKYGPREEEETHSMRNAN